MDYPNNDRYEGEWVDDLKHGKGNHLKYRRNTFSK